MKKIIDKVLGFRSQVTVFSAVLALTITYHLSPITLITTAQQSSLQVQFSPARANLKTGEEKIIKLTLTGQSQISAVDLKFQTSGITITDFREIMDTDTNLTPFEYKQITEDLNLSNPQTSFILNVPNSKLPKSLSIYMKVKSLNDGQGKITLDYNTTQILTSNNSLLQVPPNQSITYSINANKSSDDFIDPASLPPINYPDSTAVINLSLKLFGALPNQSAKTRGTVVAVGRNGETKYETAVQEIELTQSGGDIFTGRVAFPDFRDGTNFSLMIKVDKYLLRRICNADASETRLGEYKCTDPSLTIRQGQNTFDFSRVSPIPGELGLIDGILNGHDLSLVRNNLNKNTKEAVSVADLNYDGTVDEKDFTIISISAGNTGRKADQ